MSALYESSRVGDVTSDPAWDLQVALMEFLESGWKEPDDGIWEVRGPRRHFTHSKVMAWVAVDRAIRSVEEFGFEGPVAKWRELREAIHSEVCEKGYNSDVGAFTQYYGSDALDASLLMMPLFGFLPATDPRVRSTIEKIEKDLTEDGFVLRYRAEEAGDVDGLSGREGAFLACSFWMADCLAIDRSRRRCPLSLREVGGFEKRSRALVGGVRRGCQTSSRQFPSGFLTRFACQHRRAI